MYASVGELSFHSSIWPHRFIRQNIKADTCSHGHVPLLSLFFVTFFVPSCSLWLSLLHQNDIHPWKMNKVASFRNLANYTQFLLTVNWVPQVLYDQPRQLNHLLSNTACHQPYPDGTFTDYRLIHFLILQCLITQPSEQHHHRRRFMCVCLQIWSLYNSTLSYSSSQ